LETLRGHERHEAGDPPTRRSLVDGVASQPGAITTIVYPSITIQRVA
jgi:hypothetical protein